MGIGSKINTLMNEKNINANELAKRVGVAPTTLYSMITRDNRKADIEVLIKIANELNVSVEYFSDNYVPYHQVDTLAAHFDGDEFTDEELQEIQNFVEFVKSKRK